MLGDHAANRMAHQGRALDPQAVEQPFEVPRPELDRVGAWRLGAAARPALVVRDPAVAALPAGGELSPPRVGRPSQAVDEDHGGALGRRGPEILVSELDVLELDALAHGWDAAYATERVLRESPPM